MLATAKSVGRLAGRHPRIFWRAGPAVTLVHGQEAAHAISTLRCDVRASYNTVLDGAVRQDGLIDEQPFAADYVNAVVFTGRLGQAPVVRRVGAQQVVLANFTLAVPARAKPQPGAPPPPPMWLEVEAWGPLAEEVGGRLNKGNQVSVSGTLKQEKWTSQQGEARTKLKVVAARISHVVGSSAGAASAGGAYGQEEAQWDAGAPQPTAGGFAGGVASQGELPAAAHADPYGMQHQQQQQYAQYPQGEQLPPASAAAPYGEPAYAPQAAAYQQPPPPAYEYEQAPGSPAPAPTGGAGLPAEPPAASNEKESLWRDLVMTGTSGWYDNRANKRNPKAPDFKRKSDGQALWVTDKYKPAWVATYLPHAPGL